MKQWLRKWLGALSIEDIFTLDPNFWAEADKTKGDAIARAGVAERNIESATQMLQKANAEKAEADRVMRAVAAFRDLQEKEPR